MSRLILFALVAWVIWQQHEQKKMIIRLTTRLNNTDRVLGGKIDVAQLDQRLTGIGAGTVTQTDLIPYDYAYDYNQHKI